MHYARVEPAANRLRDGNPTFFAGFTKEKLPYLGNRRGSAGKCGARRERQELIKRYIFEFYSALSQSVNLRFSAPFRAVYFYAMFDERFNRESAKRIADLCVIRG